MVDACGRHDGTQWSKLAQPVMLEPVHMPVQTAAANWFDKIERKSKMDLVENGG